MGKGEVVYSDAEPDKWQTISPEGIIETLWEVACKKR